MKIKHFVCLLFLLVLFNFCAKGQQLNQMSLTTFNSYKDFNAYAGFDQKLVLIGHIRNQWINHPGNPSFQYIGAQMPIYTIKAGVGLDFENISEGNFNYKKARVSFNKVFSTNKMLISIGGRIGFNQISLDGSSILTPQGNYQDGNIDHKDKILFNQLGRGLGLGYDVSTFVRYENYQFGLALIEAPGHELDLKTFTFKYKEHLNLHFSGFFLATDNIQFQPSITVRTDFVYLQSEISGIFNLNGSIFGGLMVRGYNMSSFDALGLMFGHKINKRYSIYYNYDIPLSSIKRTSEGSHELLIKMNLETFFGKPKNPKIIYNPRFLK